MYTTQASLPFIFLIVFIGILIIMISFIFAIIKHRRFVKKLRQAKIEAEITTLDNERKRIAADIHDELGPLLSAAKLKYSEAEVFSTDDQKFIEEGHRFLDQTVNKLRLIASDLMPTALLYKGPVIAIKEFIEQIVSAANLTILLEAGKLPDLTYSQSLHIYRILKEIIHNTLKHADAKSLKIEMYAVNNQLIINTVDNGKGFNYKSMIKKGCGLGLYNVHSRADILNGDVQVKSKIGMGTKFYISIPL